jgi:hypothetical protein
MTLPVYPTLPGLTFTVLKTPEFDTLVMKAPNSYEVRIAQSINPVWKYTLLYDFLHDFPWGTFTTASELRTLMGFFTWQSGMAGSFLFTDPDDSYVGTALLTTAWTRLTYKQLGQGILDVSGHWQKVTTGPGTTGSTLPTFSTSGGTTSDGSVVWTDQGHYAGGFPNTPFAQLSLVNDGAGNYYSPIQRTLDGNFFEDVTDLNGSIVVYANGTLATVGSSAGQYEVMGPGLALPTASYMGMYLKWGAGTPPTAPITAQFNFYFRVRFESDSQDFEKFLGLGSSVVAAGQGGGFWTIGGSEAQNGTGTLKLCTARPTPL